VGEKLKEQQEAAQQERVRAEEEELEKDMAACTPEQRSRLKDRFHSALEKTPPDTGNAAKAWARVNPGAMLLWLIAAIAGALTSIIVVDSTDGLGKMLWPGGYLHFGLFLLAGFMAWRVDLSIQRRKKAAPETVRPVTTLAAIMLVALIYLSVVFFAATVYCYIPVYKGGGDFTTESPSIFYIEEHFSNAIPASVISRSGTTNNVVQTVPLYILQQNGSAFFVAAATSSNNPSTWRQLGRSNKPTEVVVIKREAVVSYTFHQAH
jgi:uncharacterized membrane protein